MSKSERLFDLMQALRRRRHPVAGAELAREIGVSERTVYRYISDLQALGAEVDAEPGMGYVLKPGFLLPPLMFSSDEIQALALGAQWVARQTDPDLAHAADNALSKIRAVLPRDLGETLDDNAFHVGRRAPQDHQIDLSMIRRAMKEQKKLQLTYADQNGQPSDRIIWPISIGFVEGNRFVAGWCELRGDFRLFRLDRVTSIECLDERYPGRRRELVKHWRQAVAARTD